MTWPEKANKTYKLGGGEFIIETSHPVPRLQILNQWFIIFAEHRPNTSLVFRQSILICAATALHCRLLKPESLIDSTHSVIRPDVGKVDEWIHS